MKYTLKINKRNAWIISNVLSANLPNITNLSISAISNLLEGLEECDDFEIELICDGKVLEDDYQLSIPEIVNILMEYVK